MSNNYHRIEQRRQRRRARLRLTSTSPTDPVQADIDALLEMIGKFDRNRILPIQKADGDSFPIAAWLPTSRPAPSKPQPTKLFPRSAV